MPLAPKKYTSLSTSVKALQLSSTNIEQLANWCGGYRPIGAYHIALETATGPVRIELGSYIVQEADGTFTPFTEMAFLKKYVQDTGIFKDVEINLENFEEARYLAVVRIADWLNHQPQTNPLMGTREAAAALYAIAKDVQRAEATFDEEQAEIAARLAEEEAEELQKQTLETGATVHVENYIVNHYHYTQTNEDIAVDSDSPVEIPEIDVDEPSQEGVLTAEDIESIDMSDVEIEENK